MADVWEEAASAVGAALGSGLVSPSCAASLRALLPGALFLRASLRCGTGLFVSEDLLQPGHQDLSVVSLKHSLAGVAMARRQPVVVPVPAPPGAAGAPAAHVLCLPVAVQDSRPSSARSSANSSRSSLAPAELHSVAAPGSASSSGAEQPPPYVGAIMVGMPGAAGAAGPPPALWGAVEELSAAAGPYLALVSLAKAADLADLLRLRAADAASCEEEEEMQDLPCMPPLSPRGDGGDVAGAAAAFPAASARSSGDGAADLATQALNAAAAAALAGHSHLEPEPSPAGAAAATGAGEASSSGRGTAPELRQRRPGSSGREAGEEDPKAALRRQQAAVAAAEAASTSAVPPAQSSLLLRFDDAALEARFAAAHNRCLTHGDVLFSLIHLAAALCLSTLYPGTLSSCAAVSLFVLALASPLLAVALNADRYHRHREALLAALLLVHAWLLRSVALPSALQLLAWLPAGRIPWLLRATGAEALALFPLGFKLRFRHFLPVQALSLALVASALAGPCAAAEGAKACLPEVMGRFGAAVLTGLGFLLPAAAVYRFEARARRRFVAAARHFGGGAAGASAAVLAA